MRLLPRFTAQIQQSLFYETNMKNMVQTSGANLTSIE